MIHSLWHMLLSLACIVFHQVLGVALHKGVTSGVMTEAIGYVLPTVLGQTLHSVFSRPEQKYQISEQCIRVLRRGLQVAPQHRFV